MAKRGRKKGIRKEPFKLKLKKETVYSISSTILLVIGSLIIVSFAQQGSLLIFINKILLKFCGWATIFLPFLFISAGLMLTKLSWKITKPNILLGGILIFISSAGLSKAGLIGKQIWLSLSSLITSFGSFLILLGSSFIGFIVLFETSLEDVLLFLIHLFKFLKRGTKFLIKGEESKGDIFQNKQTSVFSKTEVLKDQSMEMENKNGDKASQETKETKERRAMKNLEIIPAAQRKVWQYPSLSLLTDSIGNKADLGNPKENANIIEQSLESFGIKARVVDFKPGPAVSQYALKIPSGIKVSKVTALSNDLALVLAAPTGQVRIEAPIPGRSLVGIEVPNRSLEFVTLKKILTSSEMKRQVSKLAIGLGLNVAGEPVIADIAKMPHILIAGSTGSGKSVAINSLIATLLFRASPTEVKLILVDPKRVELTRYNGIPHLLAPVIIKPKKVISALKWASAEMEERYRKFASAGARNLENYNEIAGFQAMPYIIIIIDELADIMLFAPSEVEDAIARIAQMARATGIHLIISTQRPSVDVITGLIKANIPCRIAFNVSSMVDSRVIIDKPGAEKLLGRGDMLYIPPDQSKPTRVQGAFVSDKDIKNLIQFLKREGEAPNYTEEVTDKYQVDKSLAATKDNKEKDELFNEAMTKIFQFKRASASFLQRKLSIGYSRAAKILDQLEAEGVIGPANGSKPREILIKNKNQDSENSEN